MQHKLTDAFIQGLKPPASGRTEITDARCIGLVLRVTSTGAKSFSFKYRGKAGRGVQRVTLGSYPDLGLKAARKRADGMRQVVADQGDPATDRRIQRTGGRTFDKLADRYMREHALRHKRAISAKHDQGRLNLHVLPKWRHRDYTTIRRADVIELVEGIIAAGKPTMANRVQSLISKIFSFALDVSLIEAHPCARMKHRGVESVGNRVLSDAELVLFWNGIVEPVHFRRRGLALRLALLTGCRREEVAGLSRAELQNIDNPADAAILLPGERTKNKRPHLVPLAPMARQTVLELLSMIDPGDSYLVPTASGEREGPTHPDALTHAMSHFAGRLAGMPEASTWTADRPTPHDLRRSVETRLASLGVGKEIRDRVLNHAPEGVGDRHYNYHDYRAEKLNALLRWEAALASILDDTAGANVVPIDARRAV